MNCKNTFFLHTYKILSYFLECSHQCVNTMALSYNVPVGEKFHLFSFQSKLYFGDHYFGSIEYLSGSMQYSCRGMTVLRTDPGNSSGDVRLTCKQGAR